MALVNVATPNLLVACVPGPSIALTVLADLNGVGTPVCAAFSNQIAFRGNLDGLSPVKAA